MTEFEQQVCDILVRLQPGEVVSYGDVAAEAGRPGAARAVGAVLARVDADIPWWRVVTSTGRLVPGHEREHARRLRAEGVPIVQGHVRPTRKRRSARAQAAGPVANTTVADC